MMNMADKVLNRISRLMYLIWAGFLCIYLVSCTFTPASNLPGKIVYAVVVSDHKTSVYRSDIYVMNPDGTNQVKLTTNESRNDSPAWSPDGQQIVFSSENSNASDSKLYIMDADGSDLYLIDNGETYTGNPAWSPNGKEIAYILGAGGGILFTSIDGTPPQSSFPFTDDIQKNGIFACNVPSWSPDSKYLTTLCGSMKEDKSWNIYKFKADGSSFECLTCDSPLDVEFFGEAHWSLDGLQIGFTGWFFTDPNTRKCMVYVMSPDGKEQKPLITTQIPGRIADWAWSPDGQWIVVVSYENPSLQFYKVDGTQSYQIMDLPGRPISVDWGK